MMRKILILALLTFTLSAVAETTTEEALILNQELKFLEDSVTNTQAVGLNTLDADVIRTRALNEKTLENTYFGEDIQEDSINTRTASPKRRSY